MPNSGWAGFFPKAVLGACGILFTMLVGYFIWLGTTLVEVKQKVEAIDASVKILNETRREQVEARSESNKQRIDALEEEGEGTE